MSLHIAFSFVSIAHSLLARVAVSSRFAVLPVAAGCSLAVVGGDRVAIFLRVSRNSQLPSDALKDPHAHHIVRTTARVGMPC